MHTPQTHFGTRHRRSNQGDSETQHHTHMFVEAQRKKNVESHYVCGGEQKSMKSFYTRSYVLVLFTLVTLTFFPNTFAQGAAPENRVRLIYFLPNDRPARPDRIEALRQLIKDTQMFYADEMQRYGFGRKTFNIETDATGKVVVHHVAGQFDDAYYRKGTINKVWKELSNQFDTLERIYFVAIDISSETLDEKQACGLAKGFNAHLRKGFLMPASGHCFNVPLAAHELGHAFGLEHDVRDDAYIMSNRRNRHQFSKCVAEWLDAHSFFNNASAQVSGNATIQMLAPAAAPNGIRLRFEVADADGLHQAMLYLKPAPVDPVRDFKLDGCRSLDGKSNTIEFVSTGLFDASQDEVTLQVIDEQGGMTRREFSINIAPILPPPKVLPPPKILPPTKFVSIPDQNLAAAVRKALGLDRNAPISERAIQRLTELELRENQISDLRPLTNFTQLTWLTIRENPISDFTPLANLKQLVGLKIVNSNFSDMTLLADMAKLTDLTLRSNKISDITALANLTKLKRLYLPHNQISDVTPLAGLVNLETLHLQDNSIRDVSPLIGLTKLTELRIEDNPIRDKAPLRMLKQQNPNLKLEYIDIDVDVEIPPLSPTVHFEAAQRPPMYWVDAEAGTLHRLIGDKVANIVPNVQNATSLDVDTQRSKFYWTEKTGKRTGKIKQANLDGSNVKLVKDLRSVPLNIVLDTVAGKLYLINSWEKVQRLDVDGSNFQANLITGLKSPKHIALDAADGQIYWTEQTGDTSGKIRRADLNGSNLRLVKNLTSAPRDLALDTTNKKLYFTNASGKVQRLNVDGSNFQPNLITDLDAPHGVSVDMAGRKIYWAEQGNIRRANLNGKNIEDVVTGLGAPTGIVLGTAPTAAPAAPRIVELPPDATLLFANYPNPFNPETWIPYQLSKPSEVTLHIYSVNGTLIRALALGHQPAGIYHSRTRAVYWDGKNEVGEAVASGVYFYTFTSGDFTATRRMLILK